MILNPSVLFVTNSLTGGGAERTTNFVVNSLLKLGTNVNLLVINESDEDLVPLDIDPIKLHRKKRRSFFETLRIFVKFHQTLRELSPDIVVLNCDLPELFGAFASSKTQLVVVEHASQPWPQLRRLGRAVRKLLKFRSVTWVAVSSHLQVWSLNQIPEYVIPNALSPYLKEVQRDEECKSEPRLVFIGRLVPSKDPQKFVQIVQSTGLKAVIFGEGTEEKSLRKLSEKYRLDIDFRGYQKNPWQELNSSDLVLITSKNEGDGLVLVETIMHRIAFLAFNIDDFLKFRLNEINVCKTEEEFVDKVLKFKSGVIDLRPDLPSSLEMIAERNPDRIARLWLELFRDLLNRKF